jgi:arginyl-tRNA--protein-N-Asp/Glu arginylyltransferase
VAPEEYNQALAMGFLLTVRQGRPVWYQSRSCRVRTADTDYQLIDTAQVMTRPLPTAEMDHIYTAYCYYKKFKKYFEVGESLPLDQFIAYYNTSDEMVAWTKLRHYTPNSIETALFVWDYSEPASKLGTRSLLHEIAWAKQAGYEYVYLGPGYERSSLYKADIQGFEWWTGAEWSSDQELYRGLCRRDSKLKSISDLYNLSGK